MPLTPAILLALATLNVTVAPDTDPLTAAWALAVHLGPDGSHPACATSVEETAARGLCLALARGAMERAESAAETVLDPEAAFESTLARLNTNRVLLSAGVRA